MSNFAKYLKNYLRHSIFCIKGRGGNSGQTFIKCLDLARYCKDLTMKLETKHNFSTSSSGASVFIHQLSESLEKRKIFCSLTVFLKVIQVQYPTCTSHGNFSISYTNLENACYKTCKKVFPEKILKVKN